jgi:hypothetical protein
VMTPTNGMTAPTSAASRCANVEVFTHPLEPTGASNMKVHDLDRHTNRQHHWFLAESYELCCRFQRHFVKVVDETEMKKWQREGNSAGNCCRSCSVGN